MWMNLETAYAHGRRAAIQGRLCPGRVGYTKSHQSVKCKSAGGFALQTTRSFWRRKCFVYGAQSVEALKDLQLPFAARMAAGAKRPMLQ